MKKGGIIVITSIVIAMSTWGISGYFVSHINMMQTSPECEAHCLIIASQSDNLLALLVPLTTGLILTAVIAGIPKAVHQHTTIIQSWNGPPFHLTLTGSTIKQE